MNSKVSVVLLSEQRPRRNKYAVNTATESIKSVEVRRPTSGDLELL